MSHCDKGRPIPCIGRAPGAAIVPFFADFAPVRKSHAWRLEPRGALLFATGWTCQNGRAPVARRAASAGISKGAA
jgi:hypothetical protein